MCRHDPANTANSWGLPLHEQVWSNPIPRFTVAVRACVDEGMYLWCYLMENLCHEEFDVFIALEYCERSDYFPQFL